MEKIGVKEARAKLSQIIDRVEAGEEILLVRRGKVAMRLVPPEIQARSSLPSLASFRDKIQAQGKPLSATVIADRHEDRF